MLFKIWPIFALFALINACIYVYTVDTASCIVSHAEVDGVNGYYYARGGRYIQRGNPHSKNSLMDIFSLFNDGHILNPGITITLSKVGWTIDSLSTSSNSIEILYFATSGTSALEEEDLYRPPATGWHRFSDSTGTTSSSPSIQITCKGESLLCTSHALLSTFILFTYV